MIDTKELRRGNQILNGDKIVIVDIVYGRDVRILENEQNFGWYAPVANLEAVPITEEILLSLGFVECPRVYSDRKAYVINKDGRRYVWSADEIYKPLGDGHHVRISESNGWPMDREPMCAYLHQLQNIIYFLTRQELVYEP